MSITYLGISRDTKFIFKMSYVGHIPSREFHNLASQLPNNELNPNQGSIGIGYDEYTGEVVITYRGDAGYLEKDIVRVVEEWEAA